MKKSRFSEQQIAFILRQAEEGTKVEEVCRKAGISEATYYNWRKKYGGLMPSEMKRLKQLEEENQRLKKLVADLSARQGDAAGRRSAEKYEACPEAGDGRSRAAAWQVSIRRACRAAAGRSIDLPLPFASGPGRPFSPSGSRRSRETRVRYGYRRIHVLLRREGWSVNAKRVWRLYREEGLQLRNKSPKRRVKAKLRDDRSPANGGQPGLGDGLRPRPAIRRSQDPGADGGRHFHPAVADDRGTAELARQRCRRNARSCGR